VILSLSFVILDHVTMQARLNQDGQRIASQLKDGSLIIQDVAESQSPFAIRPEGGEIQSMVWVTSERLAIGTKDGHFSLWDAVTRQRLPDLPPAPTPVYPIAFSRDGKRFLSGGIRPKQRRLWKVGVKRMEELPTPKSLEDMLSNLSITSAAFSPDGNLLSLGTLQGEVGIWDLRKERWSAEPMNLDNKGVFSTVFSPDGKWLASGHLSGYVVLWDVERGRQFGPGLRVFAGGVSSLAFSADGKRLIAADRSGQNLAVVNVDPESWIERVCQVAQPTLSRQEWKRFMGDQAYPTTCSDQL